MLSGQVHLSKQPELPESNQHTPAGAEKGSSVETAGRLASETGVFTASFSATRLTPALEALAAADALADPPAHGQLSLCEPMIMGERARVALSKGSPVSVCNPSMMQVIKLYSRHKGLR